MRSLRRGYSLVELLVTLGVIAALLAVTLPALRWAREWARAAGCGSNLRQLSTVIETRMVTPGTLLPYFVPGLPASPPSGRVALGDVFPAGEYAGVLGCPSDAGRSTRETSYEYHPGIRMYRAYQDGDPAPARTVTRLLFNYGRYSLLADDEPRHGGRVQVVFAPDGSVAAFED